MSLQYEPEPTDLGRKEAITIVVGRESFPFVMDESSNTGLLESAADEARLRTLSARIVETKAGTLVVKRDKKEIVDTFTTLGARAAIGKGRSGILDGCTR